jgi:hypothetical protein
MADDSSPPEILACPAECLLIFSLAIRALPTNDHATHEPRRIRRLARLIELCSSLPESGEGGGTTGRTLVSRVFSAVSWPWERRGRNTPPGGGA